MTAVVAPVCPTPLVSVIIPAFNAGRFIEATLRSVLSQRYRNLEALVVDDGSVDDTVLRVTATARADERVRLIQLARNSGCPAVARNRGLAEAAGNLVAFLDADDLWTGRKLSDQVSAMLHQPDLTLVYSMFMSFGAVRVLGVEYGVKPLPFRVALNSAALELENTIPCSSVIARVDAVRAAGGFDEDPKLAAVEDYDLWLRLSRNGRIGFIRRIHGFYRVHPQGISRTADMSERARYLLDKRGVRKPAASRRHPPVPERLARATVHSLVIASVKIAEWLSPGAPGAIVLRTASNAS